MMTSQKVVKTDGTVKSFRCKARECLPATGRLRNEAYIEVRRNDAR
jgi:hypothetical protein